MATIALVVATTTTVIVSGVSRNHTGRDYNSDQVSIGKPQPVACPDPSATYACGEISLTMGADETTVRYIVDGDAKDRVTVWLPGGPNSYATLNYLSSNSEVRRAFPDGAIVVFDPPRDTASEWAGSKCWDAGAQENFFGTLTDGRAMTSAPASQLAADCADTIAARYGPDLEAQVIRAVLKSGLGATFSRLTIYASSFDSKLVSLLASDFPGEGTDVIVDSGIAPQQDGETFLADQVKALRDSFPVLFGPQWMNDYDWSKLKSSDQVAYVMSLARVPNITYEERLRMLQSVTSDEVETVADQYFRRYGNDEYSALNGLYYSGVCNAFTWPSESAFDADEETVSSSLGVAGILGTFLYEYHRPCLTWPNGKDVAKPEIAGNLTVGHLAVLASSSDPVVGTASIGGWTNADSDARTYLLASTGHWSLLSGLECMGDEVLGEVTASQDCGRSLSDSEAKS